MTKLNSQLFDSHSLEEYKEGTELIKNSFPLISVLGGSRIEKGSSIYRLAENICKQLALNHYNIITGGGNGIMEAANKGALLGGGLSYGFNLARVDEDNLYISSGYGKKFENLSVRKALIIENSLAFLFFPGGFGTYDELFEIIALVQTERIPSVPIFLIGNTFWSSFLNWFNKEVVSKNYADKHAMDMFIMTENSAKIIEELSKLKRNVFT